MILTRLDLSDDENLRNCRGELNRILDIIIVSPDTQMQQLGAFAIWGAKWGEAVVAELEMPSRRTVELVDAENEATKAEMERDDLKASIEAAVDAFDTWAEKHSYDAPELAAIFTALELALAE